MPADAAETNARMNTTPAAPISSKSPVASAGSDLDREDRTKHHGYRRDGRCGGVARHPDSQAPPGCPGMRPHHWRDNRAMTDTDVPTLSSYPHLRTIPTRWKDNDVYGHVNNVEYYSFFDTVINAWLIEEGGLDIHAGETIGVCAESGCRFLAPVAFPEPVEAGLRVEQPRKLQRPIRDRALSRDRRATRDRPLRPRLRRPGRSPSVSDPGSHPRMPEADRGDPVRTTAAVLREMGTAAPYSESETARADTTRTRCPRPG